MRLFFEYYNEIIKLIIQNIQKKVNKEICRVIIAFVRRLNLLIPSAFDQVLIEGPTA